jgi:large subunit ribosomal protein L2
MSNKLLKPMTAGTRGMSRIDNKDLTKKVKLVRSLREKLSKHSGRNSYGRITVRHQGGGHKQAYRIIDFKRNKFDVFGIVKSIEYDPNRNVRIALVVYNDGDKRYILQPEGVVIGTSVCAALTTEFTEIKPGNSFPLSVIPLGTQVHNIEMIPGNGGKIVRSAGTSAQIVAKDGEFVTLRLPSSEMRMIRSNCMATVGVLGNADYKNLSIGKAGRNRWLGKRPTVRGVVMNPVDHPHGGGEGKAPIGRACPVTPWGKPTLGYKTRSRKHQSNQYIVRRRTK